VIGYLDSSVLVRKYLGDEGESNRIGALLADPTVSTITGTWSRIEVTGALVRAARAGRGELAELLAAFEDDASPQSGTLVIVDALQSEIEGIAYALVRQRGIRAVDAWHLASAYSARKRLADPGETFAFVTRDAEQRLVADDLGFVDL
jgi:predicted nucleic acid-binding protein